MNLGFDLDEVVVNLMVNVVDYLKINYAIDWSLEKHFTFSFHDNIFVDDVDANKIIADDLTTVINDAEFQFKAKPVKDAVNILSKLKKAGHNIFFITARPEKNIDLTLMWLRKYKIPFDKLYVIGKQPKGLYAQKLKLDMFVDDSEKHLESMLQYKSRWAKGLLLMSRPWNINYKNDKILRVNNWQDILKHVTIKGRDRIKENKKDNVWS